MKYQSIYELFVKLYNSDSGNYSKGRLLRSNKEKLYIIKDEDSPSYAPSYMIFYYKNQYNDWILEDFMVVTK
jgi:hypothetical protein